MIAPPNPRIVITESVSKGKVLVFKLLSPSLNNIPAKMSEGPINKAQGLTCIKRIEKAQRVCKV